MKTISVEQLAARQRENPNTIVIDVRSPSEFRGVHAESAQNLPLDQIDKTSTAAIASPDQEIYLICQSGIRSQKACERFESLGYKKALSVNGGTAAWQRAGFPVVKGENSISIERQVRITAGLLAFTGAVLAWFISPSWILLPGFVGAGLAFAGITDTCAMGLFIAKMPWNR